MCVRDITLPFPFLSFTLLSFPFPFASLRFYFPFFSALSLFTSTSRSRDMNLAWCGGGKSKANQRKGKGKGRGEAKPCLARLLVRPEAAPKTRNLTRTGWDQFANWWDSPDSPAAAAATSACDFLRLFATRLRQEREREGK